MHTSSKHGSKQRALVYVCVWQAGLGAPATPLHKCTDEDVANTPPFVYPRLNLVPIDDGGVPLRHEVQRGQDAGGAAVLEQLLVPGVLLVVRPVQVVPRRARHGALLPVKLLVQVLVLAWSGTNLVLPTISGKYHFFLESQSADQFCLKK